MFDHLSGKYVLPGQTIQKHSPNVNNDDDPNIDSSLRITKSNAGLTKVAEHLCVTRAGKINIGRKNYTSINTPNQHIYRPSVDDVVLGIVIKSGGDFFKVDINQTTEPAIISFMNFEGVTKRNRPDVQVGDLLYARIIAIGPLNGEIELTCVNKAGKSGGLGMIGRSKSSTGSSLSSYEYKGRSFIVGTGFATRLLSPESLLLKSLARLLPFEIAIGINGRIWIKGRSLRETLTLSQCIIDIAQKGFDDSKLTDDILTKRVETLQYDMLHKKSITTSLSYENNDTTNFETNKNDENEQMNSDVSVSSDDDNQNDGLIESFIPLEREKLRLR